MAAVNRSQVATHNYRFSSFLGGIHLADPKTLADIAEAKAKFPESEIKKGFTGSTGEGASAKVLADLATNGFQLVGLEGNLTSAKVKEILIDGRATPYLVVGLRDDAGRYYLSVSLSEPAAQMLVRKLANVVPGAPTEYRLWMTYGQKEGKDRAYAEGAASLRQNGVEVRGIPRAEQLATLEEAAAASLEAAGVPRSDKETHGRRRATVALEYHLALMDDVVGVFDAYYAARKQGPQSQALQSAENFAEDLEVEAPL